MPFSFPPCPECGGERALFKHGKAGIPSNPRSAISRAIMIYTHICLECGYTTLRIHPNDMQRLHQAADALERKAQHSCPECGGPQVFFNPIEGLTDFISLGFMQFVGLRPCICLKCGHLTKRAHPDELSRLRAIAEKRGPLPD